MKCMDTNSILQFNCAQLTIFSADLLAAYIDAKFHLSVDDFQFFF